MGTTTAASLVFACILLAGDRSEFDLAGSRFTGHRLENGLVVLVSSHEIGNEYFAVFHRHGLLDDGPGETQWSHLLEHLAVRATDTSALRSAMPEREGLLRGEVSVNGETTGGLLRLEAIFPADDPIRLTDIFPRVKAWADFEIALEHAEFEATRATGELELAERTGLAHKWALVAWNQAARGAKRVEMREALTRANRDDLAAAARRLRGSTPPILLFHGGLDPAAVLAFAETIPVARIPDVEPRNPRVSVRNVERIEWDLRNTVIVAVCESRTKSPSDRLFGTLVASLLNEALWGAARGRELVHATCSFEPDLRADSGRWFLTATVADGATPEAARSVLERVLAALREELLADSDETADRLAAARRGSFGKHTSLRAVREDEGPSPYHGMQSALEAAQHRITLAAFTNAEVEAAYAGLDVVSATSEFTAALAADRWTWLTITSSRDP